jgi:hypothetical protein
LVDVLVYTFSKFFAKIYDISKFRPMVGNIVDVRWATIKSGCLPITASSPYVWEKFSTTVEYQMPKQFIFKIW